ncbi:MAG: hypothetical protein HYX64_03310 [Gammaproteobacteria bacterium]|nr:hypothetical protein [Gammaproteobacteria bacterium]
MNKTRHFEKRMSQRGISKDLADLALELGYQHGDRYVLGRRELDRELDRLDERRRLLLKARDKGGVVVVAQDYALVTTYRFEGGIEH